MRDLYAVPRPVVGPAIDHYIALAAVTALGFGLIAALVGAGTDRVLLVGLGGAVAACAFGVLITGGWIDPVLAVLLTVPLPIAYAAGDLRIAAVAPITAIAVVGWFLQQAATGGRIRLGEIPLRTLLVLGCAVSLSTLPSEFRGTAMREVLNLGVLVGFLILAVDFFLRHPKARLSTTALLFWSGAVCGLLAVLEGLQILPGQFQRWGTSFNRAALGFGQPNALGLFFALVIPFSIHEIKGAQTPTQRWLSYAGLSAMIGGIAATFSRGSWIALLLGSVVLFFAGERRFLLRIWLGVLVAVVLLELLSGGALSDTARRTPMDWVLEQRAGLMLAGVLMYLDHPLLGIGPGGFEFALDKVGTAIPGLFDYLPTPHNAFVQMAAETGTIGLLAFLALLVVLLRYFIRRVRVAEPGSADRELRRAVLWSFASMVVACLVVWPFSHGTGQVVMLVCALGLADDSRRSLL